MSNGLWWGLAASMFVAIGIMIAAFIIMRVKINKIKKDYAQSVSDAQKEVSKAVLRENHGELLWELKAKSKMPLEDIQLEFLINTALRNEYKTFTVLNSQSDYEKISLETIAKAKSKETPSDLSIIFNGDDLQEQFDKTFKLLKEKQMVAIVNAPRKHKQVKNLISYLKMIKGKYDWLNIGQGIVLVVK